MRTALPLALAVGVVAAAPGVAAAKAPARAHVAGGDVVSLQYPSLVKTRVGRAKRALHRAIGKIEDGQGTQAATTFKVVRRQMAAAWRGAKYVIRTTPPPPATEDAVRPRARKSGGAPVGPTLAAPADTAMLVLTLQHKVAANVIQLVDGAHGTGLNALATTLNFTDDRRDAAMSYILSVAPPAPPADDARVHAHAAGGAPVASTFDTVMPNLIRMAATGRPASSRPPSQLTEDSSLGAVIDAYLAGNASDGDRRELRSALSHVAAELGTMPVRSIRARHVVALLDDLSDAGLSTRRETAVLDALHAVFVFAVARGLADHDPTPGRRRRPPATPPRPQASAEAPTPTLTMLALGARVALWTTWVIVIGFLVLLVVLLFEFG